MSTNQEDPKSRFSAGRVEDSLITLVIVLQLSFEVMTTLLSFFWAHLVVNSYLVSREEFTFYPEILALAFVMAASVYLLHRLYETD
jgi:hypothetical protein